MQSHHEVPGMGVSQQVISDSLTPWTIAHQAPLSMDPAVGSLSSLQGIFPTQGLNLGLPHCRWILYRLSHQDKGFSVNLGTLFIP